MKLLQLLLSSLCVICAHTNQDESCLDGRMPASCESVPNPCENAVCPYYSEVECRVDACNNCSHLFYDDETGTVLKCNDEPLLCASCLKQDGDTCEPGVEVKTVQCDQDELCGNFEAIFQTEEYNISVSYQGCVSSHTFERKEPSCYENDDFKERFKSVFNSEEIREGYGCVCTEDMCNNVDLYTPTNEEIISCVDDVGLWFNPGYFLVDEKCDARFCDNRGEFRCIAKESSLSCEFDDYSYENGENFKSGIGNCVCNDGTVSCSKGDHAELVCYTSSLSDTITGINICSEDSVCLEVAIVLLDVPPFATYVRGCYNNTLLGNKSNCNYSLEDIQDALPLRLPKDNVRICVCNTSFCNEQIQHSKNETGANCSYDGSLIDHNLEFDKDECNLCKCHNGEVFCTTHPCTTPNEAAIRLLMSTPKTTRESLESTGQPMNMPNQQIDSSNSPIVVSNGILIVISLVLLLLLVSFTYIVIRQKQNSISQKDIQFHRDNQKHNDSKELEMDVPIEFKGKEITNRAYILVESEPLGRGQYGDVYRGTLIGLNGNMERTIVAVKTPKCDASVAMKEDFLDEIKLITDIGEHPHIMPLYGCCTMTEPYYLITEFMKYGALDNFLLRCRNMENAVLDPIYNLEELNQVQIAWQISKGMAFLSTTKFFHGDLAARNCLVGSNLIVKISDFGLSDDIYLRGYKRIASEKKRPVKWYSPEANLDGVCSTKGDVWSYGVVMWEIYTLGDIPYPGMPAPEVIERIANGYRLPPPDGCPSDIYAVMLECWQQSPKERPTFSELEKTLELLLHQRADKDIQVATSEQNRSPYLHIEDQQGEPTASSRKSSLAAKLNLNIFFGTSSDLPKMDKSNPSSASPKEYSEIVGKTIPSVKSLEKSLPPSDKRWSADSFDFDPELISGDSDSVVFLNILDEENGSVEAEEIAYIGDCNFALAEEDREISFS